MKGNSSNIKTLTFNVSRLSRFVCHDFAIHLATRPYEALDDSLFIACDCTEGCVLGKIHIQKIIALYCHVELRT